MKQLVIALMVALTFSSTAWGQKSDTIYKKGIISVTQTKDSVPGTKVDPHSGLEYTDVIDSTRSADTSDNYDMGNDIGSDISQALKDAGINGNTISGGLALSALAIIMVFGFPLLIVFFAFYFRYKNKKAKYRVIEQALASGQPLPEELLKENYKEMKSDKRQDGIKQTFLGLGLFIFLWAITGSFGVGCIGLLVMCIGLGKWITTLDKNRTDDRG